jgi:hypothetical protein
VHSRPGRIQSRQAKKAAITPIFVLHPSGSVTHFSDRPALVCHAGFPDNRGEPLLATENLQPVNSLSATNTIGCYTIFTVPLQNFYSTFMTGRCRPGIFLTVVWSGCFPAGH